MLTSNQTSALRTRPSSSDYENQTFNDTESGEFEEGDIRVPRSPQLVYHRDSSHLHSHQYTQPDPTALYSTQQNNVSEDLESGGIDNYEKEEEITVEDASDIVTWDGPNDPENPQNWPRSKKWRITVVMGLMTFIVTFASSVLTAGFDDISREFHVSSLTATLSLSLFVWGFAAGPFVFGPGSELYGRRLPLFVGYAVFIIFQIPVAVARNLETIMLARFIGGAFGSAPLAIVAGAFFDFWEPQDLGSAVAVFVGATFGGPVFGPVVGEFVVKSHLGWRWTMWLTLISGAFVGIIAIFCIPETYAPVLLTNRAKRLRVETKNWALHSKREEQPTDLNSIFHKYLLKPAYMLVYEPILLMITIYIALIYGILYIFFEAYPISFEGSRHWISGVAALPFLGIGGGIICATLHIVYYEKVTVPSKMQANGGASLPPEDRLILMIIGGFMLPVGLFWFAWTSNPSILWVPQVLSGVLLGWGIILIFMQGINYLVALYKQNAASAISANTIVRALAGGGFPLFAGAMYRNLGVPWATSLLAFLCVAMIPAPIAFYFYGERLRKMSRHIVN